MKRLGSMESQRTLDELANYAAANLPEGWEIECIISAGSGSVRLFDPFANWIDLCCDDSLEEQVMQAVSYAKEHDAFT